MNSLTMQNISEPPFAVLPTQINIDPNRYYKTTRDLCYWTNDTCCDVNSIDRFIEKAKEFNYTEEQALAVLTYNQYDYEKSECDLHIYRPVKGLGKVDVKQIVKVISDGIAKTVKSREHRDFDDILLLFPGFTIGDVLGAYSKHRFLIKKQTYRVKRSIKKAISKPLLTNGYNLKENESSWNESCLDTQFQLVYQKQYQMIHNSNNLQEMITNNLTNIKQSTRNGIIIGDMNSYGEADGMLNLLRKMNRKKNKPGSALDKTQLFNILNLVYSDKYSKALDEPLIKEDINFTNPSPYLSTPSNSPNADITSISSKEQNDENHFEEKLHDYIKGKNRQSMRIEESEFEDDKITDLLNVLLEQHERVLDGFKNYLPNPNEFQQLCHSWNNMDFAILLIGLSEYGMDFNKISDAVFTKSESMIRSFYLNYNSDFSLSEIIPPQYSEVKHETSPEENRDELIPLQAIKTERTVNDNDLAFDINDSIQTFPRGRATRKTKNQSSSSTQISRDETSDCIVTRSLRSRIETKEIMKSIIEEEKKSVGRRARKRNAKSPSENHSQQSTKRSRKL